MMSPKGALHTGRRRKGKAVARNARRPIARLAAFAKDRGWKHFRLLSLAGNDVKRR